MTISNQGIPYSFATRADLLRLNKNHIRQSSSKAIMKSSDQDLFSYPRRMRRVNAHITLKPKTALTSAQAQQSAAKRPREKKYVWIFDRV